MQQEKQTVHNKRITNFLHIFLQKLQLRRFLMKFEKKFSLEIFNYATKLSQYRMRKLLVSLGLLSFVFNLKINTKKRQADGSLNGSENDLYSIQKTCKPLNDVYFIQFIVMLPGPWFCTKFDDRLANFLTISGRKQIRNIFVFRVGRVLLSCSEV